jgi:hypothetical protein
LALQTSLDRHSSLASDSFDRVRAAMSNVEPEKIFFLPPSCHTDEGVVVENSNINHNTYEERVKHSQCKIFATENLQSAKSDITE